MSVSFTSVSLTSVLPWCWCVLHACCRRQHHSGEQTVCKQHQPNYRYTNRAPQSKSTNTMEIHETTCTSTRSTGGNVSTGPCCACSCNRTHIRGNNAPLHNSTCGYEYTSSIRPCHTCHAWHNTGSVVLAISCSTSTSIMFNKRTQTWWNMLSTEDKVRYKKTTHTHTHNTHTHTHT